MEENPINVFLDISVLLTGCTAQELEGTGMLNLYYNTLVSKEDKENIGYFFAEAASILAQAKGNVAVANAEISSRLMPDANFDGIAKKITVLWYSGMWYPTLSDPNSGYFVSAESYQQGLMWTITGAHPPGAKQPGYGSWADRPLQTPSK